MVSDYNGSCILCVIVASGLVISGLFLLVDSQFSDNSRITGTVEFLEW